MANTATVSVQGLGNLTRTLRRAGTGLDDLKDANQRAAVMVAQWASLRAPHRTGKLGMSVRGSRRVGAAVVTAGSSSVPYAGPIHWGWPARHIKAQPWMSEAAVETQPAWLPIYHQNIQDILNTVQGT